MVQDEESGAPVCRVTMSDITERKQAERAVEELAYDLGERVKELNCLHGISDLVEIPGISLEEILQGTVDLIPPAWQYPEVTCARITLEGQEFSTENFCHSPWQQTAGILARGEQIGTVQVGYLQERPASDEGPFLKEEREPAQHDCQAHGQDHRANACPAAASTAAPVPAEHPGFAAASLLRHQYPGPYR